VAEFRRVAENASPHQSAWNGVECVGKVQVEKDIVFVRREHHLRHAACDLAPTACADAQLDGAEVTSNALSNAEHDGLSKDAIKSIADA
jgi:hypothetical protein